jgi:hypothetical protein
LRRRGIRRAGPRRIPLQRATAMCKSRLLDLLGARPCLGFKVHQSFHFRTLTPPERFDPLPPACYKNEPCSGPNDWFWVSLLLGETRSRNLPAGENKALLCPLRGAGSNLAMTGPAASAPDARCKESGSLHHNRSAIFNDAMILKARARWCAGRQHKDEQQQRF